MYFPGHFEPDAPPAAGPSSQRRPWSPINYDEDIADNRGIHDHLGHGRSNRALRRSEDSVEALDLADYARTLHRPTADRHSPYPPFPHTSHVHPLSVPTPIYAGASLAYPEYPPSPDTDRPFSASSRDTFANAPPSLVSGATSHDSHDSYNRRPYSLPPFFAEMPQGRGPAIFSPSASSNALPHRMTSPVIEEEDISRFPAFSRGWYDDPLKLSNKSRHTSLPPYSSERHYDPYGPLPSAASSQSRNILPWSSQRSDIDGPPVNESIKEERMRMLEREFGPKAKGAIDKSGEHVVGSVDEKGVLITVGPKKRTAARWAQGILALGAAFSSLYGALFIKPKTPAPPAAKAPAFALYILSVATFLLVFYLFAIRPCCCGKRRKADGSAGPTAAGMMVLPVSGLPGGKKKKNKKGKKGKNGGGGGGDVQVNLIVDPSMFGRGPPAQDDGFGSDDEFGSQVSAPRRQQRRGIFQGLEMEREWVAARKFRRRMVFVDVVCLIVWAGVFIFILLGKKCPPGQFSGWCDSYNIATAAACLLSVAYGFSAFFGIVDLHMSKASPRTRT